MNNIEYHFSDEIIEKEYTLICISVCTAMGNECWHIKFSSKCYLNSYQENKVNVPIKTFDSSLFTKNFLKDSDEKHNDAQRAQKIQHRNKAEMRHKRARTNQGKE